MYARTKVRFLKTHKINYSHHIRLIVQLAIKSTAYGDVIETLKFLSILLLMDLGTTFCAFSVSLC
jgi:hypothetical protein